ncbi:hypothetical protein C2E25_11410 [Geothermobacter hydrogeniphilus]|uniref:Uncharacterized protein n=1 Tax=Geothermobacter hydrogeniphilus TaxID=1969733 RepID=A0A2K2H8N5_9BACT|nr:FAD-dependent oxidoreductase [Geothermobacter hydrogeniphilus]PNU19627.1 hypothetical protein C2E25_11410 [Geothermobacter hydrogeniphilus]
MALQLREVALRLDQDESELPVETARALNLDPAELSDFRVVRRSIDARKRPRVLRVFTVRFSVADEDALLRRQLRNRRLSREEEIIPVPVSHLVAPLRVLVVGMGPAGLFAAWNLARHGVSVTLLERGRPVEERLSDVERFWTDGCLDERSNVQFGEGGAGTFSDGKLTTRVNHPGIRTILRTLVDCGAPESILVDAKPHVGTDRLRGVLVRFRRELQRLGVDVRFSSCLSGLQVSRGRVVGGLINDADEVSCDALVLAPGHSARDTYAMLSSSGVQLEAKPFALGLRVEHPAVLINRIQYGLDRHPKLPAADYRLAWNDAKSGRGVYSFCMCPGGEVINASSESGRLAVNGMSHYRRDSERSNSALVVSVDQRDYGSGVLAGMFYQQRLEERAFKAGGGGYRAPAQNLMAFLGRGQGPLCGDCRPGLTSADLRELLPSDLVDALQQGIVHFDRRMRGFMTAEAVLIGIESRTSAPLRIVRNVSGESLSHPGLYPAGEGAGYAGGIMSAALDGLKAAEQIIKQVRNREVL